MNFVQYYYRFLFKEQRSNSEDECEKANAYFNIGHHGDSGIERDDFCWLWIDDKLLVGNGRTHNLTFGSVMAERAKYKGWYDTGEDILSFVDNRTDDVRTVDDIPARVYNHLKNRFHFGTIKVF